MDMLHLSCWLFSWRYFVGLIYEYVEVHCSNQRSLVEMIKDMYSLDSKI